MSKDKKTPSQLTVPAPYSPTLPNELWVQCWKDCKSEELQKLSTVSRLFREICSPIFFRSQKFAPPSLMYFQHDQEECQTQTARLRRFSNFVCNPHKLKTFPPAQMVRRWEFCGALYHDHSEIIFIQQFERAYNGVCRAFIASLPHYPNLHELFLSNFHIDNTVSTTLESLPLEVLGLADCVISQTEGSLLTLKSLTLKTCCQETSQPSSVKLFSFEKLTSLSVSGYSFANNIIGLNSIASWPSETILTRLEVTVSVDITRLISLLKISPCIEDLEVQELDTPLDDQVPLLSADIIPRLKRFRGPAYLGRLLVPGRPVEVVYLNHSHVQRKNYGSRVYTLEYILSVLQEILHSTATIRRLGIPRTGPTQRLFADILLHFPHLQVLDVTIEDPLIPRPNAELSSPRSKDLTTEPNDVVANVNETDSFIGILNWITSEPGLLPAGIEEFALRQAGESSTAQRTIRCLSEKEANKAWDTLKSKYPSLTILELAHHKIELKKMRDAGGASLSSSD